MSRTITRGALALVSIYTLGSQGVSPVFAETETRVGIANTFGPVNVTAGQTLKLCASNAFGRRPLPVRFLFLDTATGRVLEFHDATLPAGQGMCMSHDVVATPGVAGVALTPSTQTLIGMLTPPPNTIDWGDGIGASSGQVVETGTGKATAYVPAVQRFNVMLPAVQ